MQTLKIDGREFKPIKNGTFEHDIWLMQRVRAAGLAELKIMPEETEEHFIERVAQSAWESGAILELLGGALIPAHLEASDWTPEMALASGKFFGSVTNDEGKAILRRQIGGILFYFFITGLSSSKTSTKSGPTMPDPEDEPSESGAASTSAIGAS